MDYYSLNIKDDICDISIFSEIYFSSWENNESLASQIQKLNVDEINVYINSYGGEVAEGLAVYNALKSSKAKVVTHCIGFACSIASVIFMAGDERVMKESSLLMIHNPLSCLCGNSNDFRKEAEDLDNICKAIKATYLNYVTIKDDELQGMLDSEKWIISKDAVSMNFATKVEKESVSNNASRRIRNKVMKIIRNETKEFIINSGCGFNGSIEPKGEMPILEGESLEVKAIADEGYKSFFIVDSKEELIETDNYTFDSVSKNHTIEAVFIKTAAKESEPETEETKEDLANKEAKTILDMLNK